MNNVSKTISWCQWTLNPVKGLCPMPCQYCYAKRFYQRGCNSVFKDKTIRYDDSVFTRLSQAKHGDRIFVGSTIELFHPLASMWTRDIIDWCSCFPEFTFIFLTKQPQNLIKYSPFPDNCWVGVSATNYTMANQARWHLGNIKAPVKFLSVEPLLEPLVDRHGTPFRFENINWVIIGAQTPYSPKTAPKISWVQEIVEAADKAKIPIFLKDNLFSLFDKYCDNIPDWAKSNDTGYLRQEFPQVLTKGEE